MPEPVSPAGSVSARGVDPTRAKAAARALTAASARAGLIRPVGGTLQSGNSANALRCASHRPMLHR